MRGRRSEWVLVVVGTVAGWGCSRTPPTVEVAFTVQGPDLIPEGIAYDPVDDAFFLSSTNLRKIVRIGPDGAVSDFASASRDGLWGVLGLAVDAERRVLWAASSDAGAGMPVQDMDPADEGTAGIFKYDLTSGDLLGRYVLEGGSPDGHFLNDLVVTTDGAVYATDSGGRAIYRIAPGGDTLELVVAPPDLPWPNGITWASESEVLFVALDGRIGRLERGATDISYVTLPDGVSAYADGLYYHEQSLIAVWPFENGQGVTRYWLDPTLRHVTEVETILPWHPTFEQPTTGAVVGGAIYIIANSQLQLFRAIYSGEIEGGYEQLADPVVLRVALPTRAAVAS